MSSLDVSTNLLRELLSAAAGTALTHRGSEFETYVLGQLEATANLVYVLCSNSGDEELEILCQQMALDALDRLSELSLKGDDSLGKSAKVSTRQAFRAAKAS